MKRSLDVGFDAAFRETVGTEVAEFVRRFPEAVAAKAPDPSLSTTRLASGDVEWLVRGLAPNTKAKATVEGPAGYRLAFDFTIDPFGMYRGSFGAGQPAGAYTLRVESGAVTLSTQFTPTR